jgi:hypothetical protein
MDILSHATAELQASFDAPSTLDGPMLRLCFIAVIALNEYCASNST